MEDEWNENHGIMFKCKVNNNVYFDKCEYIKGKHATALKRNTSNELIDTCTDLERKPSGQQNTI
jgi:hypothetical protein